MKKIAAAAVLALFATGTAVAHHAGEVSKAGDIVVSHSYTYENAEMAHSMRVYLTLDNQGDAADRLVEASVDFADDVHFQAQVLEEGTLKTSEVEAISVEPGQVVTMQPGAVWIELEGVQAVYEHGEHFHMTLTFETAGTVEVEVEVEEAGDHGEEHDHDHAS